MANLKISQLTDGSPVQGTDQFPINRAGSNFRISGLAPTASPTFTGTVTLPANITAANTITIAPTSGATTTLTTPAAKGLIVRDAAGDQVLINGGVTVTAASGNSVILTDGGAGFQFNGVVTAYGNGGVLTLGGAGFPPILNRTTLTAQSAAIAATTLLTTGNAATPSGEGLYRISYCATVTRAATTSCSLGGSTGFQILFTDVNDSVVKTSNPTTPIVSAVNATGTTISGDLLAFAKRNTNIQYKMDYTSVGGTTMQYDLMIAVEYLG